MDIIVSVVYLMIAEGTNPWSIVIKMKKKVKKKLVTYEKLKHLKTI